MNRISVFLLFLLITACSGSGGSDVENDSNNDGTANDNNTDDTQTDGNTDTTNDNTSGIGTAQLGVVRIEVLSTGLVATTPSATFKSYSPALNEINLPAQYIPSADSCVITEDTTLPRVTTTEVEADIVFYFAAGSSARQQVLDRAASGDAQRISAGNNLVFTSPAGTFSELDLGDSNFYQLTSGSVLGEQPASLIADIPGAVFPAFASVNIPVHAPFEFTDEVSDISTSIRSNSRLTWSASSSDTIIVLSAQSTNFDANPISSVNVFCVLPDDGEFEFTSEQQSDMLSRLSLEITEPAAFSAFRFERVSYMTLQSEDALLIVQSTTLGNQNF